MGIRPCYNPRVPSVQRNQSTRTIVQTSVFFLKKTNLSVFLIRNLSVQLNHLPIGFSIPNRICIRVWLSVRSLFTKDKGRRGPGRSRTEVAVSGALSSSRSASPNSGLSMGPTREAAIQVGPGVLCNLVWWVHSVTVSMVSFRHLLSLFSVGATCYQLKNVPTWKSWACRKQFWERRYSTLASPVLL